MERRAWIFFLVRGEGNSSFLLLFAADGGFLSTARLTIMQQGQCSNGARTEKGESVRDWRDVVVGRPKTRYWNKYLNFAGNQFRVQTKSQSCQMLSTGKYPVLNFQAWNYQCPAPVGSENWCKWHTTYYIPCKGCFCFLQILVFVGKKIWETFAKFFFRSIHRTNVASFWKH